VQFQKETGINPLKQRKRFELIPHIKYYLIFDERVDRADLTKLKGPQP